MYKGILSRQQAVEATNVKFVARVEAENCQPTGISRGCSEVELMAEIEIDEDRLLQVYYYLSREEYGIEDLSDIDWMLHMKGYEIVER